MSAFTKLNINFMTAIYIQLLEKVHGKIMCRREIYSGHDRLRGDRSRQALLYGVCPPERVGKVSVATSFSHLLGRQFTYKFQSGT